MKIDAGFFIWMVMTGACLLLLLACLFSRERPARSRHVAVLVEAEEAPADTESPGDKETRHWTAQGLHKLGYSMAEARRMADMVPRGYGLQDAIQWCLRNKGSKQ